MERIETWALELERRGMDQEKESVGAKGSPYPLIKAAGILRLPTRLKLAYSQGPCKWHGWITHARIDENPVIRGDKISASTRRANKTASRYVRWQVVKNGSNNDRAVA